MKKIIITVLSVFGICVSIQAQEAVSQTTIEPKKENTLNNQFNELLEKSNSWEIYKVIDRVKLNNYQKNVIDSLETTKSKIKEQQQIIDNHSNEVDKLNNNIAELQNDLEEIRNEKDSVSFLGILLPKATYSLVMWGIILVLACMLLLYVYRYTNGSSITKKALQDLNELQEEYENYRKSAIEREQKVRRQLQDEINKHK